MTRRSFLGLAATGTVAEPSHADVSVLIGSRTVLGTWEQPILVH
jgi:hypothetical protein